MAVLRQPVIFMPHGGGPCFQLPDGTFGPKGVWNPMRKYLESIQPRLPRVPDAILIVSAHWEETVPTVLTHQAPPLLYDYYGFPSEAYRLAWPAPGAPQLAARVRQLLNDAGVKSAEDSSRGFDHGVFVPMLVAFPEAQVPVTQLSLLSSLDPGQHIALGAALEPLSAENVLILASGFSFHNMAGFGSSLLSGENPTGAAAFSVRTASHAFDDWLVDTLAGTQHDAEERRRRISAWSTAPNARECHPREEHLLPLFVAAAAAGFAPAEHAWTDAMNGTIKTSAFEWWSRDITDGHVNEL